MCIKSFEGNPFSLLLGRLLNLTRVVCYDKLNPAWTSCSSFSGWNLEPIHSLEADLHEKKRMKIPSKMNDLWNNIKERKKASSKVVFLFMSKLLRFDMLFRFPLYFVSRALAAPTETFSIWFSLCFIYTFDIRNLTPKRPKPISLDLNYSCNKLEFSWKIKTLKAAMKFCRISGMSGLLIWMQGLKARKLGRLGVFRKWCRLLRKCFK